MKLPKNYRSWEFKMHVPVLLKEVIEVLNPKPGEFFIDGTVGSGGHSAAILEKIGAKGILLGVDLDKTTLQEAREKIAANSKFKIQNSKLILIPGNYADLPEILKKIRKADPSIPLRASGLLLDLGMSSEQLEHSGRGFSFSRDEPLDMRYNANNQFQEVRPPEINRQYLGGRTSKILTAAEVINSFGEKELAEIFYKYGEERFSRRIARKIIEERRKKRILTTFDLVEVIKKAVPKNYEKGRLHPATRIFQALRIYVNQELENLEKLLKNLDKILKPKGRVAIISFHSLEDRLVKNYFREMVKQGKAEILTKKPIRPTIEEIKQNPRSRSAKLRAAKMTNHDHYSTFKK